MPKKITKNRGESRITWDRTCSENIRELCDISDGRDWFNKKPTDLEVTYVEDGFLEQ